MRWKLAVLLAWSGPLLAATVFKSVDRDGHVTYADAPLAGAQQVERLEIQVNSTARSALDETRLAAMVAVTERMAADRREREKNRAEARRWAVRIQPAEYEDVQRYYLPSYRVGRRHRKRSQFHYRPTYPHGPITLPAGHMQPLPNLARAPLKPYPAYVAPAHLQLGSYRFRR